MCTVISTRRNNMMEPEKNFRLNTHAGREADVCATFTKIGHYITGHNNTHICTHTKKTTTTMA